MYLMFKLYVKYSVRNGDARFEARGFQDSLEVSIARPRLRYQSSLRRIIGVVTVC